MPPAVTRRVEAPVCVDDLEAHAEDYLSRLPLDYYRSGSDDMQTVHDNRAAYQRYRLRPRILRNVSSLDIATKVLGNNVSSPICIAPTALQRMAHDQGEVATASAARRTNSGMMLSSWSSTALEEVVEKSLDNVPGNSDGGNGLFLFQLYVYKDREMTKSLVQRAERAGYKAIAMTVDTPYLGKRRPDIRNAFQLPPPVNLANFSLESSKSRTATPTSTGSGLQHYVNAQMDPSLTWSDVKWVQSLTTLPVLVKGVMRGDDARDAVAAGVGGVIVSNHGGRQLDGVQATIDVLEEVVQAVNGAVPVYIDGGIRRGTDVFKALALGASAVFIGRPAVWGLAWDGQRGVEKVLQILNDELRLAMALSGCAKLSDIRRDMVLAPYDKRESKL